jgi:putative aldouronate transport system permease protein
MVTLCSKSCPESKEGGFIIIMDETKTTTVEEAVVIPKNEEVKEKEVAGPVFAIQRIVALIAFFLIFIPGVNPSKVCGLVNKNMSLFTSGTSYSSLIADTGRAFRVGWVSEDAFVTLFVASLILLLGVIAITAGACISLGNLKMKRLSIYISLGGSVFGAVGLVLIRASYNMMCNADKVEKVEPNFPTGFYVYLVLTALALLTTVIALIIVPKADKEMKFEMESKFKLFLMFLPFALLAFVFCYLPLFGWRYAFFDYQAGDSLTKENFVGFKWFTYLFQNAATRRDIVRVLRNTLAMSGLGILTSWVPLAFAVLLTEIENKKFRRFVQTFTTVPNFISWIIVYTIALAIFSTDGFVNSIAMNMGWITTPKQYLMGDHGTWLKMLAWGLWKGTGWSAIIYIAGISGIDRQLYEAATVDGANRFQRIWNVTLPGLLPTYMVMLLMSVAGMLSNGLDQYLVFSNASNSKTMEVLDLYVYNLGIAGGSIPLSTVIGMAKSIVSVVLLFMANGISKLTRGESIV